jgi:hypothetical protein
VTEQAWLGGKPNTIEAAEGIAKHMPGWRSSGVGTIIRETDGAWLVLYLEGERFEITAGWPAYASGERFHPDKYLKITVSVNRSAETMAAEIERRLLPDYLPAYTKALAYIREREGDQRDALRCAESLAPLVGATVHENGRGGFGLYDSPIECISKVHVRPRGRVSIELTDLDEVTAARILSLLKLREEAHKNLEEVRQRNKGPKGEEV